MALPFSHLLRLRVRYSETDALGTFYNSRVLEWFECGRTELLRAAGMAYRQMEQRGLYLPLVEAHVKYLGRAQYDDVLEVRSVLSSAGKASLRFDVTIDHAANATQATDAPPAVEQAGATPAPSARRPVASGYTLHAMTTPAGKPMRCPDWLTEALQSTLTPEGGSA